MAIFDGIKDTISAGFNALDRGIDAIKSGASTIFSDPTALNQYMGNYRFPSDLTAGAGRNFYMDIQFRKYQRRSIFNQPFLQASGGIQLPIPNNLVESLNIDWRQPGATPVTGAAIESLLGATNNLENLSASDVLAGATQGGIAGLASGAVSKLTQIGNNIVSGAGEQGLQLIGRATNPFLTVLFKQPTFKTYSFSWQLAPRNAQESETIAQIILAFKANMLPALNPGTAGVFLTYPNMAIISLYPAQDFLFKFKPCVVTDFSVDYTNGGMPSFFRGTNAPTLIGIRLRLTEIEYWLREDIVDPALRSQGALVGTALQTGGSNQNFQNYQTPTVSSSNGRGPR